MAPRHSSSFARIAFAGVFCACAATLFGGEKLRLSVPQEKADFQVEPQQLPQKNSSSLNLGKSGPGPDFSLGPSFFPTTPSRRSTEDDEKKKNWIFATPEDSVPKLEDIFRLKDSGADQNKKSSAPTFFGHAMEDPRQKNDKNNPAEAATDANGQALSSSRNQQEAAGMTFRDLTLPDSRLNELGRPGTFSDFWNDKLNLYGSRDEQSLARRMDYNQLLQPRNDISAFNDATRQPVNPIVPAPSDILGRSSQSSLANQWKDGFQNYSSSHSSALEGIDGRALGRISSPLDNTRNEAVTIRPAPATLPFPTRPGELFKRPGSF